LVFCRTVLFSVRRDDTFGGEVKFILIIDHAARRLSDGRDFGFDFQNFM